MPCYLATGRSRPPGRSVRAVRAAVSPPSVASAQSGPDRDHCDPQIKSLWRLLSATDRLQAGCWELVEPAKLTDGSLVSGP